MAKTSYAIALGSNRRHGRHGAPAEILRAAIETLGAIGEIERASSIRDTPAMGPAGRSFANAAVLLLTELDPAELLRALKVIEWDFGRRGGRRWGPRVLDLDIILWSEGSWSGAGATIPHPSMRVRRFVLDPLAEIAQDWRDPVTGATVRQLLARLRRARPVDRASAQS